MKLGVVVAVVVTLLLGRVARAEDRAFVLKQMQEERRLALVIGNGAYKSSPLRNPANDATLMARTLRERGFDVDQRTNLDQKAMKKAIRDFGRKLGQGGVGLFLFRRPWHSDQWAQLPVASRCGDRR